MLLGYLRMHSSFPHIIIESLDAFHVALIKCFSHTCYHRQSRIPRRWSIYYNVTRAAGLNNERYK